ncbi:MAG: hypothetical protein ACRCUC_11175 [Aestuariivirga sp.]
MTAVIRSPREATACNVTPIRPSIYDEAYRGALSAGANWPLMLGYAQTLSQSPNWTHTNLAKHIRAAASLRLAGVTQADPIHRDRSDMVDSWREAALVAEVEETPAKVAMRFAPRWPEIVWWGAVLAVAMLAATEWL